MGRRQDRARLCRRPFLYRQLLGSAGTFPRRCDKNKARQPRAFGFLFVHAGAVKPLDDRHDKSLGECAHERREHMVACTWDRGGTALAQRVNGIAGTGGGFHHSEITGAVELVEPRELSHFGDDTTGKEYPNFDSVTAKLVPERVSVISDKRFRSAIKRLIGHWSKCRHTRNEEHVSALPRRDEVFAESRRQVRNARHVRRNHALDVFERVVDGVAEVRDARVENHSVNRALRHGLLEQRIDLGGDGEVNRDGQHIDARIVAQLAS